MPRKKKSQYLSKFLPARRQKKTFLPSSLSPIGGFFGIGRRVRGNENSLLPSDPEPKSTHLSLSLSLRVGIGRGAGGANFGHHPYSGSRDGKVLGIDLAPPTICLALQLSPDRQTQKVNMGKSGRVVVETS